MQTVFSEALLAGLRARTSEEQDRNDPDDRIDPDDSGPRLSVTLMQSPNGEIYALPATQVEQTSGRCPHITDHSRGPQSAAGAPAPPDLLDPAVLRIMPPRVAVFCCTSHTSHRRGDGRRL